MGLANSSLEKHKEAVDNFKKALELEPDNESYKSNLQIAEDKVGEWNKCSDRSLQVVLLPYHYRKLDQPTNKRRKWLHKNVTLP